VAGAVFSAAACLFSTLAYAADSTAVAQNAASPQNPNQAPPANGEPLPPSSQSVAPVPAGAQPTDTDFFNGIVGAAITYDDNLFRLGSGTDAQPLIGHSRKGDMLYSVDAGVKVDKPYGLQRFQLDALVTDHRYQENGYLNWTGLDYRGAWLWQITPHLGGELSASQTQSLADYSDYRVYNVRNIQTVQTQKGNFDWWIDGGWHLLGGVIGTESRNTAVFTAVGSFDQQTAEAAVRYVTRDGSSLTFTGRESQGQYQDRPLDPVAVFDNHFKQHEAEMRGIWLIDAQSTLDARLGYLARRHEHFSQRDFSGPVGRIDYIWTPTVKVIVDVSAARSLYSFQEFTNSYYVADSLSLQPKWLITEKTSLHAKADLTTRDFRGAVAATPTMRYEKIYTLSVGAEWKATRKIKVNADISHQQRNSNFAGFSYVDNMIGLNAQFMF
jgi:exopolysaccharide biosynthesis operon protein EpsL